ncbi:MAG TPA: carbohydrate-binding domain-containing protein [Kiritimatiellia bacterium]|nr:carbohydrate-binding domain-containing protein [Kiritimatiellia bacterium]HRZ12627.1 carbohydrate-binding domain-containing protein [Kiritimatiellia bacterium]HSA17705.1 carbohydrate-binding domain-containing protein [Kiritimatiellia bacterium]
MHTRAKFILAALAGTALLPAGAWAADADYVENAGFTTTVTIAYAGASATLVNHAGAGVTITQNGAMITATSTIAGVEYILSGAATGGYLKIQGAPASKVTLNGVALTCTNGPAINVQSTNRCFVVLADGTDNALADSAVYTESGQGSLYSAGPMIVSGRGRATVTGRKSHGIYSAGYFRMRGGDVAIPSAVKDGIHAVRYFRMDQGTLTIAATSDGIDADAGTVEINGGAIAITSVADDTKGIKCDGTFTVNGGAMNVTVKGVQSKGFKSTGAMTLNGGAMNFVLTGNMYLVITNNYGDPSYCTAIKGDTNITINAGTITISHVGTAGKGISADGSIVVQGGVLDILTSGGCSAVFTNDLGVKDVAAADGLKADRNLDILGGTITAVSQGNAGDAISCEGAMTIGVAGTTNAPCITAATRGQKVAVSASDYSNPKAIQAGGNLTVNGGTIRASTRNDGGEGLESKARLAVNGGNIEITAYDDCINAASNLAINGGRIYCYSLGNDGIDCNGPMQYTGGTIVSSGTTAPEEGFDCDMYTFAIGGGVMVGTGGGSSTPTAGSSTQRSVLYSTTTATSGTVIQVKSASTNIIVYRLPRSHTGGGGGPGGGGMKLLFSTPAITNTTYTIVTGVSVAGGTEFHGLYTGGTVSGGTTTRTFTASSMVTTVN